MFSVNKTNTRGATKKGSKKLSMSRKQTQETQQEKDLRNPKGRK